MRRQVHPRNKPSRSDKHYHRDQLKHLLRTIHWNDESSDELRQQIVKHVTDLYHRCGVGVAVRMAQLFERYQHRIGQYKYDSGHISDAAFDIVPKSPAGIPPRWVKPFDMPKPHEDTLRQTIETLLPLGMIRRVDVEKENITVLNRLFSVTNNDGTQRVVSDYVYINAHSKDNPYPTPNANDMLKKFHGKTLFSTFDIVKAFLNIPTTKRAQKYMAFVTKYGVFTWMYMPFGPKNAPATWAQVSDRIFRDCLDLIKYVDDLVLASAADKNGSEIENHLAAIEMFFSRLESANLKINLSKCTFFQREIKFLGQIISAKGRRVDDAYVRRRLT